MDVKRQQVSGDQLYLFEELAPLRPGAGGEGGTGPAACEASQATTASIPARALTVDMPDRQVCRVTTLKETAGYDEYVRWCGRTGGAIPPPTRSFVVLVVAKQPPEGHAATISPFLG